MAFTTFITVKAIQSIEDNILKVDGKTALFKDAYWVKNGDENEGDMWRVDTEKQVIEVQETNFT